MGSDCAARYYARVDGLSEVDTMDAERTDTDVAAEPDFKRLPPRIKPEQMVESQAANPPNPAVHAGTESEWQIRTSGAG